MLSEIMSTKNVIVQGQCLQPKNYEDFYGKICITVAACTFNLYIFLIF